jgi:hypothetical protein
MSGRLRNTEPMEGVRVLSGRALFGVLGTRHSVYSGRLGCTDGTPAWMNHRLRRQVRTIGIMAKPTQTLQRWGRLRSVFSTSSNMELHAQIASISVLFEDLRIELAGISADTLGELDEIGKSRRSLYFLRRSIATLHEFTNALNELDKLPSFESIRTRFNEGSGRHWRRALTYLRKHERYVARMRHHVGGHFGKQAAMLAIESLLPDAVSSLEIALYGGGGGAKLFFESEIAATALLKNISGTSSADKARKMIRHAIIGFRHAVRAVYCVTVHYLWDRFGS